MIFIGQARRGQLGWRGFEKFRLDLRAAKAEIEPVSGAKFNDLMRLTSCCRVAAGRFTNCEATFSAIIVSFRRAKNGNRFVPIFKGRHSIRSGRRHSSANNDGYSLAVPLMATIAALLGRRR